MSSGTVVLIGTGFVADYYMPSLRTFPGIEILGAYDRRPERLQAFTGHWNVPAADSLEDLLAGKDGKRPDLVLNLTNPRDHYAITRTCLEAGLNVYSEKPLATDMAQAREIHALARERGLILASAPCSMLSEAGQAVIKAVREEAMGTPRLVYAELDDDFIPAAPYKSWTSTTGAPWPYEDEFQVGCTLEHAGYYLTWLMAAFGPVERVVAASAELLPMKEGQRPMAPDFSTGTLFFRDGMVARLTCSIAAPHDHTLTIVGDRGVLEVGECWANTAPVKVKQRFTIRRRLVTHPLGKRIGFKGETHPKVGRRGAASMNFALGPAEVLDALRENRDSRLGGDFALHLNEVTLALQNAGSESGSVRMETSCERPAPMPWAQDKEAAA
jgi:predicted dehydrogenase